MTESKQKDKKKVSTRAFGDITQDIEPLLQEMMYDHKCQWHEILGWLHAYLQTHYPEGREVFTCDKSNPVFYYGHKEGIK